MLLHDSKQARREGMLGMRLAATRHPAARCPGGAAHARAREAALPVATAAADGARSSAAPGGTRAVRAIAATGGTSTGAARAVAAAAGTT